MNISRRSLLGSAAVVATSPGVAAHAGSRAIPDAAGANGGYAHPDWLVGTKWLERHLNAPRVKVVALTSEADFSNGHIPGAAQIDWRALEVTDTSPASLTKWQGAVEQTLTALGLDRGDTIMAYDGGTLFAARLWWVLDHLGQKDKRVLDGGLPVWTAAGGKVEQGKPIVRPALAPYKGTANPADLATLGQVKASLDKPNVVLLDTRTMGEYVNGHIPGAINVNYPRNALSSSPHFWKSAHALHQLYASVGATPNQEIIPYCSTGVRSAVTFFTLRLIGYPDVRLYTGSWDEWSQHPDLPKTKGDHP